MRSISSLYSASNSPRGGMEPLTSAGVVRSFLFDDCRFFSCAHDGQDSVGRGSNGGGGGGGGSARRPPRGTRRSSAPRTAARSSSAARGDLRPVREAGDLEPGEQQQLLLRRPPALEQRRRGRIDDDVRVRERVRAARVAGEALHEAVADGALHDDVRVRERRWRTAAASASAGGGSLSGEGWRADGRALNRALFERRRASGPTASERRGRGIWIYLGEYPVGLLCGDCADAKMAW
jgi:hypothetical protein